MKKMVSMKQTMYMARFLPIHTIIIKAQTIVLWEAHNHQVRLYLHHLLQTQVVQAVATSNAKYGKRDGETAQLATRTEEGIAVIVMGEEVTTLAITIMSVAFVEEQALAQCAEAEENTRRLTARGSKTLTIKLFKAKQVCTTYIATMEEASF